MADELTAAALAEIEARDAHDSELPAALEMQHRLCFSDRRTLLAEVRRLRALIAHTPFASDAEQADWEEAQGREPDEGGAGDG